MYGVDETKYASPPTPVRHNIITRAYAHLCPVLYVLEIFDVFCSCCRGSTGAVENTRSLFAEL